MIIQVIPQGERLDGAQFSGGKTGTKEAQFQVVRGNTDQEAEWRLRKQQLLPIPQIFFTLG